MNQHEPITKSMALAYLERAVAEKGRDYRLEDGCKYFDPETREPVCIVGFVFHYHGYTAADFVDVPSRGGSTSINTIICGMLRDHGFNGMTGAAAHVLHAAQRIQDMGNANGDKSWGTALDAAKAKAAEIEGE